MKKIALIFFIFLALISCGDKDKIDGKSIETETETENIDDLSTLESTEQGGGGESSDQIGSRK